VQLGVGEGQERQEISILGPRRGGQNDKIKCIHACGNDV
jgi:hypothetical protein